MSKTTNYDIKKFETFESKEQKDKMEDFHKKRVAFLIIDNSLHFLCGSTKSHLQWAADFGLNEEQFNSITRGYALNNELIFYKGNFTYDNEVIQNAKTYAVQIKEFCKLESAKVYAGLVIGKMGEMYPPDKFLFNI